MIQRRKTKQRELVLAAVRVRCDHPSAEQVYQDVLMVDEHISRGTVYRNLNILVEEGDLLQVKLSCADRYDRRLDLHYHLVCRKCNTVLDAPFDYNFEWDQQITEKTGFITTKHHTVYEGICPNCI